MGVRISALTETTTMADANTLPTDAPGGTRRISWANIKTAIFGAINGLTSKSTPVGADVIAIGDSAASFAGKKSTLAQIKTALIPAWAIRWDTHAGYGSTDTRIPYFTNKNTDTSGSDLTIVNNATNGLRLTIVSTGVYAVSYWYSPASSSNIGISLNSSQLTTNISSITAANRLALSNVAVAAGAAFVSWAGPLTAGDVIRPHADAIGTSLAGIAGFTIQRLS